MALVMPAKMLNPQRMPGAKSLDRGAPKNGLFKFSQMARSP
jgi:hypothetical protein